MYHSSDRGVGERKKESCPCKSLAKKKGVLRSKQQDLKPKKFVVLLRMVFGKFFRYFKNGINNINHSKKDSNQKTKKENP